MDGILILICIFFLCAWLIFRAQGTLPVRMVHAVLPLVPLVLHGGRLTRTFWHDRSGEEARLAEIASLLEMVRMGLIAGLPPLPALQTAVRQRTWKHGTGEAVASVLRRAACGQSFAQAVAADPGGGPFLRATLHLLKAGEVTGGSLIHAVSLLQGRVDSAREAKRRVRVSTAQVRFQARVLMASPGALVLLLLLLRPASVLFFLESAVGRWLGVGVVLLNLVGMAALWGLVRRARI